MLQIDVVRCELSSGVFWFGSPLGLTLVHNLCSGKMYGLVLEIIRPVRPIRTSHLHDTEGFAQPLHWTLFTI